MKVVRKEHMRRKIERALELEVGRPVQVSFSHLGKDKDYSVAIQTTLYEFDGESNGPKGTMYLSLNSRLLQNQTMLMNTVMEITNLYRKSE